MTSSNESIFRATGLLCGEFTGHRWILHTKASDAELWCFDFSSNFNGIFFYSNIVWNVVYFDKSNTFSHQPVDMSLHLTERKVVIFTMMDEQTPMRMFFLNVPITAWTSNLSCIVLLDSTWLTNTLQCHHNTVIIIRHIHNRHVSPRPMARIGHRSWVQSMPHVLLWSLHCCIEYLIMLNIAITALVLNGHLVNMDAIGFATYVCIPCVFSWT